MINLYDSKTVDFNNNGIGSLKDMINCFITEELNGVFEFEAEYPLNSNYVSEIKNENILKLNIDNNNQLFRIKKIAPNLKTIKIYGRHITYDLKDNNLDDVYPKKQNCNNMGDWILNRTQYKHNFSFYSDIEKIRTARYVDTNPLKAIMGDQDNSFLNLFGGEIVRDNFMIKLLQNRGSNNGYKLSKTKNITGLEIEENNCNLATRLIPKAYDGIKLPEKYIDSPLINIYPHPYIQEVEFSDVKLKSKESTEDDEGFETLEELYEELRKRCYEKFNIENIDKPVTNVKVNFVELSKTDNYLKFKNMETLKLGDYVTLITDNYNITLQVIKIKYNVLLKRYVEIELGTKKINFVSSTTSNMNNIISKFKEIDPIAILNQAKINATNQITSALGGYTYKTQNEFYIMDTDNPNTAQKVWRWNLNGLGYSANGFNGPYELAMTQDGQIVADFITAGQMSVERIKGLNEILLTIQKNFNFEKEIRGYKDLYLDDCLDASPLYFSIKGYSKPFEYIYPSTNLYPSADLYPTNFIEQEMSTLTIVLDKQIKDSPTVDKKEYKINIKEPLRSYEGIYDEIVSKQNFNGNIEYELIRRIKLNNNQLEILNEPIVEKIPLDFNLIKGGCYLYLSETNDYEIDIKFLTNTELNKFYASKMELNSSIKQLSNEVSIVAEEKLDGKSFTHAEIVAKINDHTSEAKINADNVNISANDVLNILSDNEINMTSKNISFNSENFKVDKNGNTEMNNAKAKNLSITGGDINLIDNADISNAVLNVTSNDNIYQARICSKAISVMSNYQTPEYSEASISPELIYLIGNGGSFIVECGVGYDYVEFETGGKTIYKGDVNGFTYYTASLEKLKKNIKKSNLGLDLIKNTDIYTYNYKTEDDKYKKHIGVVIGDKYKTPKEILNNENDGIDTYSMVSVCFNAIKQLNEKVEKLENRIKELESDKND